MKIHFSRPVKINFSVHKEKYCKFILTTNLLFWQVETDFLAIGNHFVPVAQVYFLSTGSSFPISWNYVLNESFVMSSDKGFSV